MIYLRLLTAVMIILMLIACTEKEHSEAEKSGSEHQEHSPAAESTPDVAELWDFHDVIHQMWHEAWPAKDTKMLADLIPEIDKRFPKLQAAEVPEKLHDKQQVWSAAIQKMAGIIDSYKKAAASGDDAALLKAAEELHEEFEVLVHLIRPEMKASDHQ